MTLEFRPPPPDLINAYLNRPSPGQVASEGVNQAFQTYAQQQAFQQEQELKRNKQDMEGRTQFYKYGDVDSLPPSVQASINNQNPVQGPAYPVNAPPEAGTEGPPNQVMNQPHLPPMIERYKKFLEDYPQGTEGMTTDTIYSRDNQGNITGEQKVQRPKSGKTIMGSMPKGEMDTKKTFQLKGFLDTPKGRVPISYDTRTGALVQGEPTDSPILPTVAPSIPGAEVAKVGELENMKEKMKVLTANYDKNFVGMIDSKLQGIKQATGFGATTKAANFKQATQDIKDSLLRARSGAQINEQEYQRLLPIVPDEGKSEVDFNAKVNRFNQVLDEMIQSKKGAFSSAGYRPMGGGTSQPSQPTVQPTGMEHLSDEDLQRIINGR